MLYCLKLIYCHNLLGDCISIDEFFCYALHCSLFEENVGSNGVVSIAYAPVSFTGSNTFRRNRGTSSLRVGYTHYVVTNSTINFHHKALYLDARIHTLQIVGSLVELYGSLSFIGNSVGDVAALHLLSLGQIRITSGLTMEFVENSGRYSLIL